MEVRDDLYFRPPSEAESFIIRVMRGCSHNKCTFCNMFKGIPFEVLPREEVLAGMRRDAEELGPKFIHHITSLYLEGGDPLALPDERLLEILHSARECFPALRRVACYATARSIVRKRPEALPAFHEAGLETVYMGVESGSDAILAAVNKGCTRRELERAGTLLAGAGIKNDVSIMLGIGGAALSGEHARETAALLNSLRPACVRIRTFVPNAGSPLGEIYLAGGFDLLDPYETLRELRLLLSGIRVPMRLLSEHWSDFIFFDASFPEDKPRVEALIERTLRLPPESFRPIGLGSERE